MSEMIDMILALDIDERQKSKLITEEMTKNASAKLLAKNGASTVVIDNRPTEEESAIVSVLVEIPGMDDFRLAIDPENMSTGDWLDITEGTMTQRMKYIGACVVIDDKLQTRDAGFAIIREVPIKHLNVLTESLEEVLIEANSKN